jgi:peroxiredoxin Q/BCP
VAVLGISRDAPAAQAKWKEKYDLPFPLLSDPDHAVHEAYGVWGEKVMYGKKVMGTVRTTFVVGADGKIERAFEKVKVDGHVAEVLGSL